MKASHCTVRRSAMSLLELIVVVTLLGIVAAIVVPRYSNHAVDAKKKACSVNKGNIEVQCQLWLRQKNSAPAANLGDIGANSAYFPEGLPACPVDNSSYSIDTTTLRVSGHTH